MDRHAITPNIIIAGATKAGTTSLFTYLNEHPEVCGSTVKEICHFLTVRFREPPKPIEDYTQYFAHWKNEKYRLESSPAYFLGGRELAEAIKLALPDVKVVLILREPVSRCISHFRFTKNMLKLPEDMTLEEYFFHCQTIPHEAFRKRENHVYYGLASGIYSDYLDDWIGVFGDNLHICFFDDLIKSPRVFTQSVCRWMGIDDSFFDEYNFVIENKGRNFKNRAIQKVALELNKTFEIFLRKNIGLKRLLRKAYFALNGSSGKSSSEDESEATLRKIREYYSPHNKVLKALLVSANVGPLPKWLGEE